MINFRKYFGFIIMIMMMFGSIVAFAQPVVLSIDEADQPYMYADAGKPAGAYPALIKEIFQRMKVDIKIQPLPWKRVIEECDNGTAGVIGLYKTPEREKKYDFSDQFFIERLVVFFPKDKPFQFSKLEDLYNKKVGIHRGWSYGDAFDAAVKQGKITAEEVNNDDQNFQKLISGKIDCVIAVQEVAQSVQKKYAVSFSATPFNMGITYLAFNKSQNKKALLDQFNAFVKAMKASGDFQKIAQTNMH